MSRELDYRVAEKFFNIELDSEGYIQDITDHKDLRVVQYYSTRMDIAMEILHQIPNNLAILRGKSKWLVNQMGGAGIDTGSSNESLPVAICLLALKIVGDHEWVEEYLRGS